MSGLVTDNEIQLHALDHAWRYFELHANQRLSMFNFFVAFSALALAGVGAVIQAGPKLALPGIFVGLMIPVVSFIFWKLDSRTAHLVKLGEESIRFLEERLYPAQAQIFHAEPGRSMQLRTGNTLKRMYSYRQAFAAMFIIVGIFGISGSIVSAVSLIEHRSSAKIRDVTSKNNPAATKLAPKVPSTARKVPPVVPNNADRKG